ncbi:uncharacterized protein LOC128546824 [Mercenaria mercenaria]|uniref:uncharacterized protein LOC128546824 n=1 Tax=Mercenaria mercenaria TaxID=6596 RepID=UPI00234FA76D|nr:uncharacterized protein LOC128546824 [Mercenaria mercenaria]
MKSARKNCRISRQMLKERKEGRQMAATTVVDPPMLEDWEDKMVQIVGESAIGGFCGVDTFKLSSGINSSTKPVNSATSVLPTSEYRAYNPPIQDLLEADYPPVQNVFEADCPQTLTNQVEISLQPVVDRSHSGRGILAYAFMKILA